MKKRKKRSRPADPWSKTRIPARTQRRTSGEVKQEKLQRTEEGTNVKITPWLKWTTEIEPATKNEHMSRYSHYAIQLHVSIKDNYTY